MVIDKVLANFSMTDSKNGFVPFSHGIKLSEEQSSKNKQEVEYMKKISYASAVASLMYVMLYTRPDKSYVVGVVNYYQSKPIP